MTKFIIRVEDTDEITALDLVKQVVKNGKVSKTCNGEQYCFHTVFSVITADTANSKSERVAVSCKKHRSGTETFYVCGGEQ